MMTPMSLAAIWIVAALVSTVPCTARPVLAQLVPPAPASDTSTYEPHAPMTPERVREAIAFGASQKEAPYYEIRKRGFVGSFYKPRLGFFTTPFLRVARAAYDAKKLYKPFTEADVTQEMLAPEVAVYGLAQADGARIANVEAIVITPIGQHDPSNSIRPTSTTDVPVEFKNAMGMTANGRSLMAVFPLEVLSEANEVHIIFDSGVHDGRESRFCEDCFVEFKLDKVR